MRATNHPIVEHFLGTAWAGHDALQLGLAPRDPAAVLNFKTTNKVTPSDGVTGSDTSLQHLRPLTRCALQWLTD
ncbi:hypothetical protein E2C01_062682 [Portunus trituberculatus]|uniref:Uncharacterized protein n=1 Tax=Portunus trituberculatus TaxID=210409 RepID=A0A5B7H8J6_PORTR|nr:hypothetical protein [Portunus trituberculatus]